MKRLIMILLIAAFIGASCSPQVEEANAEIIEKVEGPATIEAFGIIKAKNIMNLTLNFAAPVTEVNVTEGQKVGKGESIITLDLKPFMQQIKEKEMELNTLRVDEKALLVELEKEWDTIPESAMFESDLLYAQNLYEEALKEKDVQKRLLDAGSISQYEYNLFEKTLESKKKALEEIEMEKEKAMYSFQKAKKEIELKLESLRSKMEGIEASIKALRDKSNMSYIKNNSIISTMDDALVYDVVCVAGDIIPEGQKAATLMDMSSLYVEANVNEGFIKDVTVGSQVFIVPEADRSREYKGHVTYISQGAYNINGQTVIPVHIAVDEMDEFLRPNFNVDVRILVE